MTFKNYISPVLTTGLFSAGLILFCGCSNENSFTDDSGFEEGIPTEIGISIGTLRSNPATSAASAADGTGADPDTDNEKINSWWLAFVDRNGIVAGVVKRPSDTNAPVELESFKCIIPSGTYNIYAFANISEETLKTETGIEFKKGSVVSLEDVEAARWSSSLNNTDPSKPLPMSGFLKGVRVINSIEEDFSIEVVRMAAKVEFKFENVGNEEITVENISIDPVTSNSISLFPRGGESEISYSHLGKSAFYPMPDATAAKQIFTLTSDNKIGPKAKLNKSFYIQESISDRENDEAFTIGLNVSHKNGVSNFEQYNITRDILSYINRNDRIVIPIALSRYDVNVEAIFYPPIGGYPAVSTSNDPEGAQIFTFGTQGDFEIVATVTDKQTGTHLAPIYYTITLSNVTDSGIFSRQPTLTSTSPAIPNEVTGRLNDNEGKASLELTVNVYDKPHYEAGAVKTNSYTRKIYIIRN